MLWRCSSLQPGPFTAAPDGSCLVTGFPGSPGDGGGQTLQLDHLRRLLCCRQDPVKCLRMFIAVWCHLLHRYIHWGQVHCSGGTVYYWCACGQLKACHVHASYRCQEALRCKILALKALNLKSLQSSFWWSDSMKIIICYCRVVESQANVWQDELAMNLKHLSLLSRLRGWGRIVGISVVTPIMISTLTILIYHAASLNF